MSGSSYSYAYATLGELTAMGVAACLLLEYGVSAAAVAVGWSQYLNELLDNLFGFRLPDALSHAPEQGGVFNLPAVILVAAVRAAADPRRQRVGEDQRGHGGDQARRAGDVHRASASTGWNSDNLRRLRAVRLRRRHGGGRHHLLLLHRSRRRVDRRRGGEEPAADDAAGDHDRAGHRHHALHAGRRRRGRAPSRAPSSRARRPGWRRSWRTSPARPGRAPCSPPAR